MMFSFFSKVKHFLFELFLSSKRLYHNISEINKCEPPIKISKVIFNSKKNVFDIYVHIKHQTFFLKHTAVDLYENKNYLTQFLELEQIWIEMLKNYELYKITHKILEIYYSVEQTKIKVLHLDRNFYLKQQTVMLGCDTKFPIDSNNFPSKDQQLIQSI